MLNDAKLAGNPARVDLTRVKVPTLVTSVEDGRFAREATARDIAATVPSAKLVLFKTGGISGWGTIERFGGLSRTS